MNALSALIVADHLLDLQREATAARLANEATHAGSSSGPGGIQRLAGRSARRLSRGFAALAARVDPVEASRQSSSDRKTRPIAA